MELNTIGKRIRYYRNKAGYTQEELANLLDDRLDDHSIDNTVISRYERDTNEPAFDLIACLASVLNIPIACFYSDTPVETDQSLLELLDGQDDDTLSKILHHLYTHYYFSAPKGDIE